MLEKLTQDQFEHVINLLILYNQVTPPEKEVYLNEKSIKEALNFMKNEGKEFAEKLRM